ncbi:hypothetical protein [Photobacterium phosphoreum]|uniref:hypothetical protein n=1 Tax=Photobacterium phosphoreum TaxID=659 RepID=UPI000D1828C3|nr:hypothetical protein [Photobacterium phosphoreum]PSU32159.1 hypothetical protein CTM85_20180 [Photobacterium phosphoreum]
MNIQNAIETLLIEQPYPATFNQEELNSKLEWAKSDYKIKVAFTDEDKTKAHFTFNAKTIDVLLTEYEKHLKLGRTQHITDDYRHQVFAQNGYLNATVMMIKSAKEQKAELKELLANVEIEYRLEVEKDQADHITMLTEQCLQDVEQQKLDDYKSEQQKAKEAIAAAFMANK